MLPPCVFRVLATSKRTQIDIESANCNPDTSIIRHRVHWDSWAVIIPVNCAIVEISATPDNTISGPHAPAVTNASSMFTRRAEYQAVNDLVKTLTKGGGDGRIPGRRSGQPLGQVAQFDVLRLGLPAQQGNRRVRIKAVVKHQRALGLLDDGV